MATFKENLKTTFARFKAKYLGYTTCSTAAATAAKTATLTNFALATGSQVKVKFTYANTASTPTLNVNSTGAKSIKAYGTTAATVWWSAGDVVSFTYDGTNWIMEASNGQIHSLNSSFSSALTSLKNTAIAQAVGATGSTFTAVIETLSGIVDRGAVSKTLNTSTTSYTVPAGYHNGSGKVSITTETKTQAPGTSAVDVTPSSGKVLSKVTVSAISTQEKTVTASRSDQTVTPDSGKYLTKVTVNKYPDATGSYTTISANGTYDMGATNNYRYVTVSVPNQATTCYVLAFQYTGCFYTASNSFTGSQWGGLFPSETGEWDIGPIHVYDYVNRGSHSWTIRTNANCYINGTAYNAGTTFMSGGDPTNVMYFCTYR